VRGYQLHPDGPRLALPGRDRGLGEPRGAGLAAVQQHGRPLLAAALQRALETGRRPTIFNTDQGAQFTSEAFTGVLKGHEIRISMDGRGRCLDNVFVERLGRSLKFEEVYLHAYDSPADAQAGIGGWMAFYNETVLASGVGQPHAGRHLRRGERPVGMWTPG
jgi:transposase InsO family protein